MPSTRERDLKIKRIQAWYNMIPNLIWSVINLAPISIYWYNLLNHKLFYIFLGASLIPMFIKNSFLDNLQIGHSIRIYKKLGVHLINNVAQNGVIINNLIKRKFPEHKVVTSKRSSIAGLIAQTYVFEKFHLILFLFFCLTTIQAIASGYWAWAIVIFLNNIAYNIYPNLLQQYIRLKLILFNNRLQ